MIDNTRLINDKRCAVVLRDFDTVNKFIELDLIFPWFSLEFEGKAILR